MEIKIDTREFERAVKVFQKETKRSLAGAINTTFSELHKTAAKHVPTAKKSDINRFAKSDLAQAVAKKNLRGKYVKGIPASKQVEMYIHRMVQAKRSAVRFTRLLVNAAYIRSRGGTPQRPGGVKTEGRKASNRGNYMNAWVKVSYTFKRGDKFRENVQKIVDKAYGKANSGIVRHMESKAAQAVERAAKKAGLR